MPNEILHLTPHLGGGVGRVVSELLRPDINNERFRHSVLLTEIPKDRQFVDKIKDFGISVEVVSSKRNLDDYAENYNLIHINWWNSPSLVEFLNSGGQISIPTIAWAHYSGNSPLLIPEGLTKIADKMIFSSQNSRFAGTKNYDTNDNWMHNIPSSCGAEYFYDCRGPREDYSEKKLRYGYIGSCHPKKIFRDIVQWALYLRSKIPDFQLHMWGDRNGYDLLLKNLPEGYDQSVLIHHGFLTDVRKAYAEIDVMIYLLDPNHYGTGENVIVEAMASGVVVIVMDNQLERTFIEDGVNGYVVKSKDELLERLQHLSRDQKNYEMLATQAQKNSIEKYSSSKLRESFAGVYHQMLNKPSKKKKFKNFLGSNPYEWYSSFWDHETRSCEIAKFLSESYSRNIVPSKGSLEHYAEYFGKNRLLDNIKSKEPIR